MNIQTVATPIHDALGITTVSASIEAEARRIANIDFASFLTSIESLSVALYGSHPSICAQYLDLPNSDYRREAAEKAKALHFNPRQIPPLASEGFFNHQLRILLDLGNTNSDYGSKLVPVFICMLEHKVEHQLDISLVAEIQRFLAIRCFSDGYTMISQAIDSCCIMPSLWGRKGVA